MNALLRCRHPLGYEVALELGSLEAVEIMARTLSQKGYLPVVSPGEPAVWDTLVGQILQEVQQCIDRLVAALRPAPPAVAAPTRGTRLAQVPAPWREIRSWLRTHPGPHRPIDVQHALGWTRPARDTLRRMHAAGVLRKSALGLYELAQTVHWEEVPS